MTASLTASVTAPTAVLEALALLPQEQRQVVVLHDVAGLTVPELAARLERSPRTVASQLVHGRAVLARHLRRSA